MPPTKPCRASCSRSLNSLVPFAPPWAISLTAAAVIPEITPCFTPSPKLAELSVPWVNPTTAPDSAALSPAPPSPAKAPPISSMPAIAVTLAVVGSSVVALMVIRAIATAICHQCPVGSVYLRGLFLT